MEPAEAGLPRKSLIDYDGDAFRVSERAIPTGFACLAGIGVRIALLPAGEIQILYTAHGLIGLTDLQTAINLIEFQIHAAIQQQDIHGLM